MVEINHSDTDDGGEREWGFGGRTQEKVKPKG